MYRISAACHSLKISRIIFKKVQDAFGGHMRYISSGGAANDPQVTRDYYALGFQLLEGYGMTETAPMISFTPPGRYKPGSPGKPIPCNEVKIVDGEVMVRGKNVMKGYYNKPQETAEALTADGWLHTGDLGYIDEDGFLFLTGRSKELIILGNGKNISPTEIEQKLMDMSDGLFGECALTDDGHNLMALIVPDMDAIAEKGIVNIRQTIMDVVIEPYNETAPSYKRIADIIIRNTPLPRTRLGKLRRHIIRQELAAAARGEAVKSAAAENPAPDTKTYRGVAACIEKIAGRAIGPDEHFELDLGMDSLAKMNLLSSLSAELGVSLQVETLAKHPTARSLAEAIDAGGETVTAAPSKKYELPKTGWTHGFFRVCSKAFLNCISKPEITGQENIPNGPCIFAPNHQSSLDAFYLSAAIDAKRFHDTYFYAISKFVDGPISGYLARHHNVVAMELNGDLRESIGLLESALKDGKSVAIFPEGTRSMDGSMGEFHLTFAQLSVNAQVPVVPVV
ncbi:MAG: AMP-binding protein, partial [Victivallales bacterium]|nr:AMP-binding protein [Victivallales bacterium]